MATTVSIPDILYQALQACSMDADLRRRVERGSLDEEAMVFALAHVAANCGIDVQSVDLEVCTHAFTNQPGMRVPSGYSLIRERFLEIGGELMGLSFEFEDTASHTARLLPSRFSSRQQAQDNFASWGAFHQWHIITDEPSRGGLDALASVVCLDKLRAQLRHITLDQATQCSQANSRSLRL